MKRTLALAIFAAAVLAEDAPDEKRLEKDHAPTPYTAAEIRSGCLEGRTSTYLMEVPGRDAFRQTLRFAKCDAEGADLEMSRTKTDGTPMGEPVKARETWKEFQSHGSFPEKDTKISEETITLPAGKFECVVYAVTVTQGEKTGIRRFHFAKKLPGPPVKVVVELDGKVVSTMTLVEHKDGTAPEPAK